MFLFLQLCLLSRRYCTVIAIRHIHNMPSKSGGGNVNILCRNDDEIIIVLTSEEIIYYNIISLMRLNDYVFSQVPGLRLLAQAKL